MTDRSLKIYQGEDLAPVTDLTDMAIWEDAEFGMRAYRGEATNSNVTIRDEDGVTGQPINLPSGLTAISLSAGNTLEYVHGSNVLWRGRMGAKDYSRGEQRAGRYREAAAYLEDVNVDLRGLVVHNFGRAAESDVARVQGVVARYLSGGSDGRPSTIVNGSNLVNAGSNLVNLPAHEYNQTDVVTVLNEIATAADKTFYLLPRRTTSDSHTAELFYDGNTTVMERCPYRISDRPDEVRSSNHIFAPIWNVGPAATENGQELISGVWLFYSQTDFVHVHDEVQANLYIKREVVVFDDTIETEGEATDRARAILSFRKFEERTINVTIGPLSDGHVGSIRAGQTIGIKARAIAFADDVEYDGKISQWKITSPAPGLHFAHLQLDRPWRMEPYAKGSKLGPQPPSDGSPAQFVTADGVGTNNELAAFGLTIADDADRVLYVACSLSDVESSESVSWNIGYVDEGNPGTPQALTLIAETTSGSGVQQLWRLIAPTAGDGAVRIEHQDVARQVVGYQLWRGAHQTTPERDTQVASGSGTASSVTVTPGAGDTILGFVGRFATAGDVDAPTATSGQATDWSTTAAASFGVANASGAGGHGGAATDTWSFDSADWAAIAVALRTSSPGTADPADVGDTADSGDDTGTYALADHQHKHGDVTVGSHPAEDVTYDNATSGLTATDVQAAVDEDAAKAPPAGGASGQVLAKASATDHDMAWTDQTGGGSGGAYAETIGDGAATSIQITHSLGTEDVVIELWDVSGVDPVLLPHDHADFPTSLTVDDVNNVTLVFGTAPATDAVRVVVLAGGSVGGGFESVIGDKSGNITTTSTTFTDLTGISLTIAAAVGDRLEIAFNASVNNNTAGAAVFFVANVGDNVIDPVVQYGAHTANLVGPLSLLAPHTVQAGDISGGLVTVKVQWRVGSNTGLVTNEGTNDRAPVLTVKNHGA